MTDFKSCSFKLHEMAAGYPGAVIEPLNESGPCFVFSASPLSPHSMARSIEN